MEENYIKDQIQELLKQNFIYKPTNYNFFIFFNIILNKHSVNLILPDLQYTHKYPINDFYHLFLIWTCNKELKREMYIPHFYKYKIEELKKNKDRYIAFPLILNYFDCNNKDLNTHMGIILYDKKFNMLELFEPGVYESYDAQLLYSTILPLFKKEFNINVNKDKLFLPSNICPSKGIQTLQESEVVNNNINIIIGGNVSFCTIFSLLYLDKRLSIGDNIELPKDTIKKLLNKSKDTKISLTKTIVDYLMELHYLKNQIEQNINEKEIFNKYKDVQITEKIVINRLISLLHNYFNKNNTSIIDIDMDIDFYDDD